MTNQAPTVHVISSLLISLNWKRFGTTVLGSSGCERLNDLPDFVFSATTWTITESNLVESDMFLDFWSNHSSSGSWSHANMSGSGSETSADRARPQSCQLPTDIYAKFTQVLLKVTHFLLSVLIGLILKGNKSHLWPKETLDGSRLFWGVLIPNNIYTFFP